MSTAKWLAEQLKLKNPEFQEVWDNPERIKRFELRSRLIEYRLRQGLTQNQFAKREDIEESVLSKIEDGELDIPTFELERFVNKHTTESSFYR